MLKTLLAVTLALMLVLGISGMASVCAKDIGCDVDCSTEIELGKSISGQIYVDVGATTGLSTFADKNVNDICQTGYDNSVGDVTQFNLGNYSEVCQDGDYHEVGNIYQNSFAIGYNVSVVLQLGGSGNLVGWIDQQTPDGGYNISSVVQTGSLNTVGNIWQSS
jgi:hypothetical protein